MHFLQFGRNPVNTIIRVSDIQTVTRNVPIREIVLRTNDGRNYAERYQEHELGQFDDRWLSLRKLLITT
jgi:hypothetical protein